MKKIKRLFVSLIVATLTLFYAASAMAGGRLNWRLTARRIRIRAVRIFGQKLLANIWNPKAGRSNSTPGMLWAVKPKSWTR